MKITLIITNLNLGGAERVCSLLANRLSKRGHEVVLILKEKNELRKEYEINQNVKIINLDTNFLSFLPKLKKTLDIEKPDTVLSFLTPINISVSILKIFKMTKAKVIIRETTIKSISNQRKAFFKKNIMNFLIRRTYKHADLIIALSEGCKEDLVNFYKIPSEKIERIYNPLDIEDIRAKSNETMDEDLRFNNKKTIICVGSFVYSKGHKYLIEAVNILNKKELSYNLLFVGEGYLENDLIEQSNINLYENQFKIINHTSNPFKFMKAADVLVLPSLWEGFGNVLIEAMAVGIPVISTTCESGPKEIITSESNGVLVEVKNSAELAKAIEKILEDNRYSNFLVNNSEKTLNNYEIDNIISKYEDVIKI